ncbi:unnamed protein product [Dracunculus medinensis]|uniref:TTC5_OB domain-containing protein n=1 Tax=Dracunculus medinensis TaxID=318479 RepID=A0A158Q2J1_DRAME|nr:unnamed protein product [Dracunculus medinensis]
MIRAFILFALLPFGHISYKDFISLMALIVGKKLENAESLVTSSMKIVLELYRSEIEKLPKELLKQNLFEYMKAIAEDDESEEKEYETKKLTSRLSRVLNVHSGGQLNVFFPMSGAIKKTNPRYIRKGEIAYSINGSPLII